jgi:hypothetical protein
LIFSNRETAMQGSSETIGAIAAALAKAQAALTNPEKALVATIRATNPRERDQTFRYAALSNGLDIVRKALGTHEIATVQTTAIDKEAGLIRLTTTLAHSSGEWLSSEWPVCAISETTAPRRMGGALTYARRYALFTLVGIAGEDDLDAPDLNAKIDIAAGDPKAAAPKAGGLAQPMLSADLEAKPSALSPVANKENRILPSRKTLEPEQSAALREQLLADLALLQSEDEAAEWVHKNLPAKNALTAADADLVEASFRENLAAIELAVDEGQPSHDAYGQFGQTTEQSSQGAAEEPFFGSTDAAAPSQIVLPGKARRRRVTAKAIRRRDKEHCKFVTTQPCVVCGRRPSEAHHIRFAQVRALGRKVSDEYTVPVCRLHHRELHRYGDEASWWAGANIDPLPIALDLWQRSRADRTDGASLGCAVGRIKSEVEL